MDNLLFAFNTILPLLLLITAGFVLRQSGIIKKEIVSPVNSLVFKIFLPAMLIKSIMNADKNLSGSGGIFIFVAISIVAMFLVLMLIVPLFSKDDRRTGVIIQGMARCNYAIFGIPLAQMLFEGRDISVIALLTIIVAPMLNVFCAIVLEIFSVRADTSGTRPDGKKIVLNVLKKIVTNPLVISCVIGFILLELPFDMPSPITTSIDWLAGAASPVALLTLGASLEFKKVAKDKKAIFITTFVRLVLCPAVFLTLAAVLGFRDICLGAVIIVFAGPVSVSSYPMAEQVGADSTLAAEIVVFTSVFSIVTIFLIIFVLKSLGLM